MQVKNIKGGFLMKKMASLLVTALLLAALAMVGMAEE